MEEKNVTDNGDKKDLDENKIDSEIAEVMKRAIKECKKKYKSGKVDKAVLKAEMNEHLDFLKKLNDIDTIAESHRIIYTDGNEQLLYTDGEFYIIDTISNERRKKLSKKQARDAYIEYFITYQINPLIEKKNLQKIKENITKISEKDVTKTPINHKAKSQVKNKVEKVINRNKAHKSVQRKENNGIER